MATTTPVLDRDIVTVTVVSIVSGSTNPLPTQTTDSQSSPSPTSQFVKTAVPAAIGGFLAVILIAIAGYYYLRRSYGPSWLVPHATSPSHSTTDDEKTVASISLSLPTDPSLKSSHPVPSSTGSPVLPPIGHTNPLIMDESSSLPQPISTVSSCSTDLASLGSNQPSAYMYTPRALSDSGHQNLQHHQSYSSVQPPRPRSTSPSLTRAGPRRQSHGAIPSTVPSAWHHRSTHFRSRSSSSHRSNSITAQVIINDPEDELEPDAPKRLFVANPDRPEP